MKIKDHYKQLSIEGKRTIITSDVHGRPDLLKRLLDDVKFSDDDILIINGDIIDKGHDSIGALQYVATLMDKGNVHVLLGNCDKIFDELEEDFLYGYMEYRYTIVHEMLKVLGKSKEDYPSQQAMADDLRTQFALLHSVLKDLPLMIETESYIIVHAGVNEDYLETSEHDALNMPFFYNKAHHHEKTVVVGHFPVCNFVENGMYHHNVKVHPNYNIDVYEGDEYFTYCEQQGEGCMVKTEYIDFEKNRLKDDYTDYFHKVEMSEYVSVIKRLNGYVLIKKDGIVGFVPEEVLE